MAEQIAPTKGNLIASKKSLALSKVGFDLLDRKRNILIKEMMLLIERAQKIQNLIDLTYSKAYLALQKANLALGICDELSLTVPLEESLNLSHKSVMGVEIPMLSINMQSQDSIPFGLYNSNSDLDNAYNCFIEVKKLTTELAEVENSVYLLADAIKKTQKKANALKNIIIPKFQSSVKSISDSLEEKEREEFSRLKFIKESARKKRAD